MALIVIETIPGLDEGKGFGKLSNKGHLKLRVPENDWHITKTLNSHEVRLHWPMKLQFSENTSVIEKKNAKKIDRDLRTSIPDPCLIE